MRCVRTRLIIIRSHRSPWHCNPGVKGHRHQPSMCRQQMLRPEAVEEQWSRSPARSEAPGLGGLASAALRCWCRHTPVPLFKHTLEEGTQHNTTQSPQSGVFFALFLSCFYPEPLSRPWGSPGSQPIKRKKKKIQEYKRSNNNNKQQPHLRLD